MFDLKDMEVLAALARHNHFNRAAADCGLSQPAFSARLKVLEDKLDTQLVRRGNRFMGLTPEGDIALRWARRMLSDSQSMVQELSAANKGLTGRVRIGSVPTAVVFASRVAAELRVIAPGVTVELRSASSDQIERDLTAFGLDVGITYLNRLSGDTLMAEALYDETYVLIAHEALWSSATDQATWADAADLPLCLLSTDMNNRRIVDHVFSQLGKRPAPVLETNSFIAALAQVNAGLAATVAPSILLDTVRPGPGVRSYALTDPLISEPIGLATAATNPEVPAVRETLRACRKIAQ